MEGDREKLIKFKCQCHQPLQIELDLKYWLLAFETHNVSVAAWMERYPGTQESRNNSL